MLEESKQSSQSVTKSKQQQKADIFAMYLGYFLIFVGIIGIIIFSMVGLFHVFVSTWNEANRINNWGLFIPLILITVLTLFTILYCEHHKSIMNRQEESDEGETE